MYEYQLLNTANVFCLQNVMVHWEWRWSITPENKHSSELGKDAAKVCRSS
jgi:hypothetical protein